MTAVGTAKANAVMRTATRMTRRCMGTLELRREVDVEPRPGTRARQRLGNVDAHGQDRQAIAHADAGCIFERIAELVEGIAVVAEHRDAKIARQIAFNLHRAGEYVLAANADRLCFGHAV